MQRSRMGRAYGRRFAETVRGPRGFTVFLTDGVNERLSFGIEVRKLGSGGLEEWKGKIRQRERNMLCDESRRSCENKGQGMIRSEKRKRVAYLTAPFRAAIVGWRL